MPRRVSMPSADDLFRPTADRDDTESPAPQDDRGQAPEPRPPEQGAQQHEDRSGRRRPSGRVRHDEKMTVYVTSQELLEIEHARLALRHGHGLAVDRGRLVREAVALVLADFEGRGADSEIVRRLTED